MPVQNSNSKISARPELDTNLPQILITATFDTRPPQKNKKIKNSQN